MSARRRRLHRGWTLAYLALAAAWILSAACILSCGGSPEGRAEILTVPLEDGFSATVVVHKRDSAAKTLSGSVTITPPSNVTVQNAYPRYDPVEGMTYTVLYDGKRAQLPISKMFRGMRFTHIGDVVLKTRSAAPPAALSPG